MPSKINHYFKIHHARQFIESFREEANNIYYVTAGRHEPWDDENSPDSIDSSIDGQLYEYHKNLIFGKKVDGLQDVVHMTNRYDWEIDTTYSIYDNTDSNLYNKNYYVVSPEGGNYHVFLCLNNNNGASSTVQPLASQFIANDELTILNDGYQWKYMFTIDNDQWDKFATNDHIPIFEDEDVQANAVPGSIDVILIDEPGSNYNAYANGTFNELLVNGNTRLFAIQSDESVLSSNDNYYTDSAFYIKSGTGAGQIRNIIGYEHTATQKIVIVDEPFETTPVTNSVWEITPAINIVGDGEGLKARAIVDSVANSIGSVEIIDTGRNYSTAKATVHSNTGIVDEDNVLIIANNASLVPVIPPPKGHGSDAISELNASGVGISVTFSNTEQGHISTNNSFRQIGLVRDVCFANTKISYTSANGSFVDGETVVGENGGVGEIVAVSDTELRLTKVKGIFESGETIKSTDSRDATVQAIVSSVLSNAQRSSSDFNVFNQTTILTINNQSGTDFVENEKITTGIEDTESYAEGYLQEVQPATLSTTKNFGIWTANSIITGETSGASAVITGITHADIVKNSGELFYLENSTPLERSDQQNEQLQLIITF